MYPIKHIVIHTASSCSCCRIVGAAESRSRIGQQDRTKVAEQASSGSYLCSFSPRPSFVSYGFSHIYLCLLAVYVLSRVLINISIARVLIILCLLLLPFAACKRPCVRWHAFGCVLLPHRCTVCLLFGQRLQMLWAYFFMPSLDSIWDLSVGLIRCPPAFLDNDYSTHSNACCETTSKWPLETIHGDWGIKMDQEMLISTVGLNSDWPILNL